MAITTTDKPATEKDAWLELRLKDIDGGKLAARIDAELANVARSMVKHVEKNHRKISKARGCITIKLKFGYQQDQHTLIGEVETKVPQDPAHADWLATIESKAGTPTLTVGHGPAEDAEGQDQMKFDGKERK